MASSVVGIQAHFSKTLPLFFLKYSTFSYRALNSSGQSRVLDTAFHGSTQTPTFVRPPSIRTTSTLQLLSLVGLTRLTKHPKTGQIIEDANLTILDQFLVRLGPRPQKYHTLRGLPHVPVVH